MNWFTAILGFVAAGLFLARPATAQQKYAELGSCTLESGSVLEPCTVGYRTWGQLNAARDNAVLVPTWYGGRTAGQLDQITFHLDTTAVFAIGVDAFGNGVSTSPSNSPTQGGAAFPSVSIGDMVAAQYRLVTEVLGLDRLYAVMGSSMGGMQTFEWAVRYPGFFQKAMPMIGSPKVGSYDMALWETRIRLLNWVEECACSEAAESLAMLYTLTLRTPDNRNRLIASESFPDTLAASAERLLATDSAWRMDMAAQAAAMIRHDVTRHFGGDMAMAAQSVTAELLSIVVGTDHMVTPGASLEFVELMGKNGRSIVLPTDFGHGGLGRSRAEYGDEARAFLARE